jgi:hypothetical protein
MARGRKEIRDSLVDRILDPAGSAPEFSFKDLLLVLLVHLERQISFADRAAENIHK